MVQKPEAGMIQDGSTRSVFDFPTEDTLFYDAPTEDTELDALVQPGDKSYDDARSILGTPAPIIEPKNGPNINLYDRSVDELQLLKLSVENEKLTGFIKFLGTEEGAVKHSKNKEDLLRATKRKIGRNIGYLRKAYHFDELVRSGFSVEDVEIEFNMMMSEHRGEFLGKENESARRSRKEYLKKRLAEGALEIDPWNKPKPQVSAMSSSLLESEPDEIDPQEVALMKAVEQASSSISDARARAHARFVKMKRNNIKNDTSLTPQQRQVKLRRLLDDEQARSSQETSTE